MKKSYFFDVIVTLKGDLRGLARYALVERDDEVRNAG